MRAVTLPLSRVFAGELLLVNAAHPLRGIKTPRLAPALGSDIMLESRVAGLLAACVAAAGGNGHILPVSGWRSGADQQQIWDDTLHEKGEAFTRSYVALPGCSEHQTGFAIDLGHAGGVLDFIRPAFPYDGVCGAFRRLAAAYGFVQRYEAGKEALTSIAPEPWHFRYVGVPHAQLLVQNHLCLEEYTAFLQATPRLCALPWGRAAQVFYAPCQGESTTLELPEGCCQISGDNVDGFIVTAWGDTA